MGLGNWMNLLPASEMEKLNRELRPKIVIGATMILSNDISEEQVVNILKKYGFLITSREMVEYAIQPTSALCLTKATLRKMNVLWPIPTHNT